MRGYVKRLYQKASKLSKEQLLELLNDVVQDNDDLYSIIESLSTGLLIVDNDFRLLQFNAIVTSLLSFNIHPEEAKDSTIPVWELLDDEEIASYIKKCADKEITNSSEEFTTTTSGGSIRFKTIQIIPLVHAGMLTGRIILVRDITENKNQEMLLHRMENMANLTNLAAGMAHEIKNPLGAISIHIQLIQKALVKARENQNLPAKKFLEDHIDVVNEEVEYLNKLIMDFLFAVRPINATLELKSPAKLIKDIVGFLEAEFKQHNFNIHFSCQESNFDQKILLDEKLLREVIINLAQNSLAALKSKFEVSDGEELAQNLRDIGAHFCIECYIIENKYVIKVRDNGCGMSQATISKIFEPYFTTKADGTGLGMTMVYKVVKEFSGDISVESSEGEGSSFTMVFPLPQKNKKLIGVDN
ncbi:MAG: PAS domain S-box protein [Treponema sp.]|nr:PAS domain S-box protein [Treponema sp.]